MPEGGFGLYVHWPFCAAKCPYCDFNSHVRPGGVDAMAYADALTRELQTLAGRMDEQPLLHSIFFGGGTPSLMPGAAVGQVIDTAQGLFRFANDIEITLEANPTSIDAGRFQDYAAAGVNRVSVGVQALNDADLKKLGRWHSAAEALAALEVARSTFGRVSFDLIYAREGQSLAAWESELTQALAMQPDHLSLYQLTIEEGTKFAVLHEAGQLTVPDPDSAADMFELTQSLTEDAGLTAYEVSNHARPGEESRHNLVYWRYGEFLGVGPGAHGRMRSGGRLLATATERLPERWLSHVQARGEGLIAADPVGPADQAREYLVMGLRLTEGISLSRHQALGGAAPDPAKLADLAEAGLVAHEGDRLRATPAGRMVLNTLIAEISP